MRAENANGEDVRIELVEIRHITACDGQRMIFTVGVGTDITHAAEVDDQFTSIEMVVDKSEVSNWADAYRYLWKELGEKWQRYKNTQRQKTQRQNKRRKKKRSRASPEGG